MKPTRCKKGWLTPDEVQRKFVNGSRDKQSQKLYSVERAITEAYGYYEKKWKLSYCVQYLDRIINDSWFQKKYPHIEYIDVGWDQTSKVAWSNYDLDNKTSSKYGHVSLPIWGRNELVILHELAHICNKPRGSPHGPGFARIYLDLLKYYVGEEVASDMELLYQIFKVKVSK